MSDFRPAIEMTIKRQAKKQRAAAQKLLATSNRFILNAPSRNVSGFNGSSNHSDWRRSAELKLELPDGNTKAQKTAPKSGGTTVVHSGSVEVSALNLSTKQRIDSFYRAINGSES